MSVRSRVRDDSAAATFGAPAEDLQGVRDVGEPVLGGLLLRPALHGRTLDLDRAPARPADQMVMVLAAAAAPVQLLAVGQPHLVDLADLGEDLQRAVDRGQTDTRT